MLSLKPKTVSEDENLCAVLESMKNMDLRVERLLLSGNRLQRVQAVTEYIWNCREPVLELDLSDNEEGKSYLSDN